MPTSEPSGVSWQMLAIVVSFASSAALGAIWIGSQGKQIEINTQRIDKIEAHDTDTRQIEAKLIARIAVLEAQVKMLSAGK